MYTCIHIYDFTTTTKCNREKTITHILNTLALLCASSCPIKLHSDLIISVKAILRWVKKPGDMKTFIMFLKMFLLQLIYSVLSVSAVQQSDPVTHVYTVFFSHYLPSCSITSDWMLPWKHLKWQNSPCLTPPDPLVLLWIPLAFSSGSCFLFAK